MTDEQIIQVLTGLSHMWWNRNYKQFCQLLGWDRDSYSEQKWDALATISQNLGQFDKESLVKMVRAGLGD